MPLLVNTRAAQGRPGNPAEVGRKINGTDYKIDDTGHVAINPVVDDSDSVVRAIDVVFARLILWSVPLILWAVFAIPRVISTCQSNELRARW